MEVWSVYTEEFLDIFVAYILTTFMKDGVYK